MSRSSKTEEEASRSRGLALLCEDRLDPDQLSHRRGPRGRCSSVDGVCTGARICKSSLILLRQPLKNECIIWDLGFDHWRSSPHRAFQLSVHVVLSPNSATSYHKTSQTDSWEARCVDEFSVVEAKYPDDAFALNGCLRNTNENLHVLARILLRTHTALL
ncbi:hypothetical protein PYCC9005_003710 [Savitreella phatthalungensis]